VTARPEGISDWMYKKGGNLVGGNTIRAVRDGLSAGEREAFDKVLRSASNRPTGFV